VNLFPRDDVSRFQLFSILFMVSLLASAFISDAAFAITLLLFWGLCVSFVNGLPKSQKTPGYSLFAVFSLFGISALLMMDYVKTPSDLLLAIPVMAIGFLVLYVIFKAFLVQSKVECKVLGYSEGYAIIETYPTIISVVPPGTYVVKSGPVRKGKTGFAVVDRKIFGPAPKPNRLEMGQK
jgi:hypothetical protein